MVDMEATQMKPDLKGIGGLLAWFVYIVVGFWGCVFGLGFLIDCLIHVNESATSPWLTVFCGISLFVAVKTFVLLKQENPAGIMWARRYLGIYFGVGVLDILLLNQGSMGLRLII